MPGRDPFDLRIRLINITLGDDDSPIAIGVIIFSKGESCLRLVDQELHLGNEYIEDKSPHGRQVSFHTG